MGRFSHRVSTLAMVLLMAVSCGWAQGQSQQGQTQQQTPAGQQPSGQNPASPQQPTPPLSQTQGESGKQQPGQGPEQGTTTGAPPLTGPETYTLGTMGKGRSYAVPSFQFAQSVATNGTGAFGTSEVNAVSTISGLLALHHLWSKYAFTARYAGTGFIYDRQSQVSTSSAHEFSISQRINGKRSSLLLSDVVTYMPESSFGYARFSGFNNYGAAGYGYGGLFGASGGNLDTTFLPSQSILTGPSSRVGNSVVGVYDYRTSPLGSITLTGAYSMLRFPSADFINNDNAVFRLGYSRTLTRKNSLGVFYQAGLFGFGGSNNNNFMNNGVSLTFRRTISERLGVQFGAGPQIIVFKQSAPGQDTGVNWHASAYLSYRFRRSTLGFTYQHYTSGGSGVYAGAQTDYASLSYSLPVTRLWSIDSTLGYARNKTVQSGNLAGVGNSFNSWYGTINVHRALNRVLSMFLSYNLQQQLATTSTCIGSTCGTFYTQQYFSIGLNWHPVLAGVE